MSKKEVFVKELEIKDVYFDFDNIHVICLKRGILKTDKSMAKEIGYTMDGYKKLKNKAPKAVAVLHAFLKENMLTFDDLVKECK